MIIPNMCKNKTITCNTCCKKRQNKLIIQFRHKNVFFVCCEALFHFYLSVFHVDIEKNYEKRQYLASMLLPNSPDNGRLVTN